ncbi:MAG: hypothetical protein ACP5JG_10170 [Anaerolineae bacterium]
MKRETPNKQEDVQMNAKQLPAQQVMSKVVLVTLLVAFAALVSAGGVAADHIAGMPSAMDVRMNRLDRFGQYLAALEMSEQNRFGAVPFASLDYRMARLDRFGQYLEALEWSEHQRAGEFATTTVDEEDHSGIRFEQYLWALEQ